MSTERKQKIIGAFLIIIGIILMVIAHDGTVSLLVIPMGILLITTKDIVIAQALDDYDDEEDKDDEE